jgi:Glucodextranase, domain N
MAAEAVEVARLSTATATGADIGGRSPTPADTIAAEHAPGWPGSPGRWTSSAKSGVGTALSPLSKVWFTLSHGILNEIYYPAHRSGVHPRPRPDRDGRGDLLLGRETARQERAAHAGGWRPRLSPRQHVRERSLPHREDGARRPPARC